MKKSLTLDSQSLSSVKRFEKPKISKTIKVQRSHFTESAKASKFENLDSLSEIFTIPQAALAQPVNSGISLSHVTPNTGDDWSDFSSATEAVFQPQSLSTGLAPSTVGQGVSKLPTHHPLTGQMPPASSLGQSTSEFTTFQWEGDHSTLQEPRGDMGIFQQSVGPGTAQTGSMWTPQVSSGSDGMLLGVNTPVSQGISGHRSGAEFGDFQSEVPRIEALPTLVDDQGMRTVLNP